MMLTTKRRRIRTVKRTNPINAFQKMRTIINII
ncbi:unnamed protein product [Schistosoma curassoni]|uniref:Uncharacterized protein n=1 Tax=Schistosoma curassoni TaxID=6186 RepID=A0A183JGV4_9TREM|nr:unnamed protein product [Schistosoma curassoni]